MEFSNSVLIESKSARDEGMSAIESKGLQQNLLSRVKAVFFALWRGAGYMTTKQVADYYGVAEKAVDKNLQRNRAEFEADGVICIRAKDDLEGFREARDIMSLASNASQVNLFPPRAVIRMGFILQDSEVAVQVRTAALNILQGVGRLFDPEVLEALINDYPLLNSFVGSTGLVVSAPLEPYFSAIERHLRSRYPNGGIPGMTKDAIRERLASLSTYTKHWKFSTQQELCYSLANSLRGKYPDLTSDVIQISVNGQLKKAVLLFQLSDFLVEEKDVELAIGRQYLKRAKDHFQVDFASLILVAPFGATPGAREYIHRDLPNEMRGYVGVMTVKEVAALLFRQAKEERKANLVKGEVKRNFEQILEYEIPEAPLLLML